VTADGDHIGGTGASWRSEGVGGGPVVAGADDLRCLRETFAIARRARRRGNAPFGALLVSLDGGVLIEAENTVLTDRDCTAHAETNLVRRASQRFETTTLQRCTLYASTEPCAMCAGAIVWSGVGRVVYGLTNARLHELMGEDAGWPRLRLSCRDVFARGSPATEVVGPVLEAEAEEVHTGFWR
jgi:tRNA(Arg) A34 adenosine deaminase TadA